MQRATLAGLLLVLTACPAPADVTPIIHVDPRAAQRLGWFGSKQASREPAAPPQAHVHALAEGQQLHGPSPTGRAGDLVLENAEVVFVVAQAGTDGGAAQDAGCIVDAADATARQDELGTVCAYVGGFPAEHLYESVSAGTELDGSAWIEARGDRLAGGKLALTTRYTLHGPNRAVLVETWLENLGDAPLEITSLGDAVSWGNAEAVAPGKPRSFQGEVHAAYVGGVGHFASYALTSTEGSVEALVRDAWTYTSLPGRTTLGPHEKAAYERVFVVGARPDTSSLLAELALAAGQPVGEVKIAVPEVVPGMKLELTPDGATESLSLAAPYEGVLPVGSYRVTPLDDGGPLPLLDVKPGVVAELSVRAR